MQQPEAKQLLARRMLSAAGVTLAGALGACVIAAFIYGAWTYQTWQYEWATGCYQTHISKAEWILGIRPLNDCRPWWAQFVFRDT